MLPLHLSMGKVHALVKFRSNSLSLAPHSQPVRVSPTLAVTACVSRGEALKEGGALHNPFSSPRGPTNTPQGDDAICHSCAHLFVRMRRLRLLHPQNSEQAQLKEVSSLPEKGCEGKGQTTSFPRLLR